ncbi:hypothetical protein KGY14_03770 [Ameyamaea chiangmaiensis]|uniref:Anti-sigma factor NepR domain-containing protein n=2 Tax=Ameyamaea chiangmaiensis TaxID=442969 RepID=A0A850PFF2_9PROT|nr:hypothetical protein [Ameyamaea chiangmaiensis]NVN41180.1 hypothetical protein [Ameyamaea chiangmaiensis]
MTAGRGRADTDAVARWIRQSLHTTYDTVLREPLPDSLLDVLDNRDRPQEGDSVEPRRRS